MENTLLVITNVPDADVGGRIAHHLVQERLAACVNLIPAIRSIYVWKDSVEETTETTLLIKTTSNRYAELEARIQSLHPYEVPEIIGVPITAGLPAYLDWIEIQTKKNLNV